MNRKQVKNFLKDNWHLVLALVAFGMMMGPESVKVGLVAGLIFGLFLALDIISTKVIRQHIQDKADRVERRLRQIGNIIVSKAGGKLEKYGKELNEIAEDIKE